VVSKLFSQGPPISFRAATVEEFNNFSRDERCVVCQEEIRSSSSADLSARAIVVHDGQHPIHRACFAPVVEQVLRDRPILTNRGVVCLTCTRPVDLTSLSRVFPEISLLSNQVSILQRQIESFAAQRAVEPEYSRTSIMTREILFALGAFLMGVGITYCIKDLKGRAGTWLACGLGAVLAIFITASYAFLVTKRGQAVFLLYTAPLIAHAISSLERTQAGVRRYMPVENKMKMFCGCIVVFGLFMLVMKLGSQPQRFIP
jgi:hypothetical protein